MVLLLYVGLIGLYFAISLLQKFGLKSWQYFSVDTIVEALNHNFQFNLYAFLPLCMMFLLSVVTHGHTFARFNWLLVLGIVVIRVVVVLLTERRLFMRPVSWPMVSVIIVGAAYFINKSLTTQAGFNMNSSNLAVYQIMWSLVAVLGLSLLSDTFVGDLGDSMNYRMHMLKTFTIHQANFIPMLETSFRRDKVLQRIFFAIMLVEDFNRPRLARAFERLLFKTGKAASTGIMQMTAGASLSDEQSVTLAQERIGGAYRHFKKNNSEEYQLVRDVAGDYNSGGYPDMVIEIYYLLKANS